MTSDPHGVRNVRDEQSVSPDDGPAPSSKPAGRSLRGRILRYGFVVAVVVALAVLLWRQREDVERALSSISPGLVAVSLLFGAIGVALPGLVWRDLLASQGYPTAPVAGLRAFFLAQLGKYLPGGVWAFVAQVSLARDLRIPARQAATATFLTLALSCISALLVAGVTLLFAIPDLVGSYWWVFLSLPVLLVLLHPRSVEWWSGTAFRLLRRPGRPVQLSWAVLIRTTLLMTASWIALGLHFGFLVQGLGEDVPALFALSTGVFALAWVAGFLVVIAPAGAGVREVVLVLGFASLIPAGAVLTVAVLSRVLLVVADVALAAAFTATARLPRVRRLSPPDRRAD
jgi:uncharacterized membrane protein YbhN (UPF0104 family)